MAKLILEPTGQKNNFKVLITGTNEEINEEFLSLWNRRATNSELFEDGFDFYCYSSRAELLDGFERIEMALIVNSLDKKFNRYAPGNELTDDESPAFVKLARNRAEERLRNLLTF